MPKGRDGQIVVDDRDDDKLDDEFDPDDGGEDDEDEGDSSSELERLRQENAALLQSNSKLEAATKRNNAELARRRKLAAQLQKHGIEDVDAWLAQQQQGGSQAPLSPEGVDEGSESPTETPETPTTGVKPPMTADDAEVARRVALALEQRDAQETERVSLLEDELRISRVETLLTNAKFKGTLEKALRVMDMDSIIVDDDGKVTGVEDAVASLQQEIPEWFDRPEQRQPRQRGTREVDGGDKPRPPARPQTWEQRISAQIGR